MDSISIAEKDELSFSLKDDDSLYFCFNDGEMYLLSEDNYFTLSDISDIKKLSNNEYVLIQDESSILLNVEEYDMIYDLIIKCRNGEFDI